MSLHYINKFTFILFNVKICRVVNGITSFLVGSLDLKTPCLKKKMRFVIKKALFIHFPSVVLEWYQTNS